MLCPSLDLTPYGFSVLFSARWIQHGPPAAQGDWRRVTTGEQLERWKAAHGDAPAITPALLADPAVLVLAGPGLSGGLIANRSQAVAGISNVFGPDVWTHGVGAAGACFPGLPLVGWEHAEELEAALAAGFADLGQLRVWLR